MKQIDDKTIDLILCDLPYGTTRNKWDAVIPFDELWMQYERIIKDRGAIVLTAAQPFTSALVMSNLRLFKYDLVWDKSYTTGFLNANKMPLRKHESILVFYKRSPTYTPQFTQGRPYKHKAAVSKTTSNYNAFKVIGSESDGKRYPVSVLQFGGDKGLHPTQKPVALFEYLIKTYTNPGDLVLDNCAGSFTTAIAAMRTDRNWVCIEKDENYYNAGIIRVQSEVDRLSEQAS